MALQPALDGLLFGVATSSLQIEGGDRRNSWYDWSQVPGAIADGTTPEVATDHWNRWRADTDLMVSMGIQTYRMSIEWSRVEPEAGRFDESALARYREEVAHLVECGIRPLVTLHHFSNPSWFQGLGEFTAETSPRFFLRYVREVVSALGDLVTDWVTINEPNVYAAEGYLFGEAPPGRGGYAAVRRTLRHMAIAHCQAYRVIHDLVPAAHVGFAHHLRGFAPLRANNPVHRVAARTAAYLFQDVVTDAFLGGRFPAVLGRQPDVDPGPHADYLGLNYYTRSAVKDLGDGTFPGAPVNDLGWEIHPAGLAEVAADLHARFPAPIWVTENGTCDNEEAFRTRFIHDHLTAIADSGLPFERYYHWCFVDNWEWSHGMVPRFGLVAQDPETLERTVKPSGEFYRDVIANRGVTPEAHARFVAGRSYPVGPR